MHLNGLPLVALVCFVANVYASEETQDVISFGSVLKLEHINSGYRLHSHKLPYASGSGQQSTTAMSLHGDSNSYWVVKEPYDASEDLHTGLGPDTGAPISCGGTVRLQHLATSKNLHSHLVQAPMNQDYEVSAFATDSEDIWRDGDSGDNWVVVCESFRHGDPFLRSKRFYMKHADTGSYLTASQRLVYDAPISGQLHVSSRRRRNSDCLWRAAEGFFVSAKTNLQT